MFDGATKRRERSQVKLLPASIRNKKEARDVFVGRDVTKDDTDIKNSPTNRDCISENIEHDTEKSERTQENIAEEPEPLRRSIREKTSTGQTKFRDFVRLD